MYLLERGDVIYMKSVREENDDPGVTPLFKNVHDIVWRSVGPERAVGDG